MLCALRRECSVRCACAAPAVCDFSCGVGEGGAGAGGTRDPARTGGCLWLAWLGVRVGCACDVGRVQGPLDWDMVASSEMRRAVRCAERTHDTDLWLWS